jgi:dTMP kinase
MESALTLKEKLTGKFIVLDGPDGSGKGTQLRLLAEKLSAEGLEVVVGKDPGGTDIGDRIRGILLNYDLEQMDVRCEAFLFMASRAQLVGEVIEPAITAGKVALCDRFISSTCAYQGAAGYDPERIIELGRYAVGDTWPQLTLIVDVPTEEGFKRTGRKPHHVTRRRKRNDGDQGLLLPDVETDAMEARPMEFHRQVRERFLSLPASYPGRVEIVDGTGTPDAVHARIMDLLGHVDL